MLALYREYFAVTPSNRIGFPLLLYPCEFPNTCRVILNYYILYAARARAPGTIMHRDDPM